MARKRGQQLKRVALEFNAGRKPVLDRTVRRCSLCDKIAFRLVGKRGFCEAHTPEAFAAARASVS